MKLSSLRTTALAAMVVATAPGCGGCDDDRSAIEKCADKLPDRGEILSTDGTYECRNIEAYKACGDVVENYHRLIMVGCMKEETGLDFNCKKEGREWDCSTLNQCPLDQNGQPTCK